MPLFSLLLAGHLAVQVVDKEPEKYSWRDNVVIATNSPVTEKGDWPEPKPEPRYIPRSNSVGGYYTGRYLGPCVIGVRKITGAPKSKVSGVARNLSVDTSPQQLAVGQVIVTRESAAGHAAYITGETETEWILHESNYDHRGTEMIGRKIPKNSAVIRGGIKI